MFQAIAVGDVLCVKKKNCAAAEPYSTSARALLQEVVDPPAEVGVRPDLGRAAWARRDTGTARPHLEAARSRCNAH